VYAHDLQYFKSFSEYKAGIDEIQRDIQGALRANQAGNLHCDACSADIQKRMLTYGSNVGLSCLWQPQ